MKIVVSVVALVLAASWMPAQSGQEVVVLNLSERDLNFALRELYDREGPRFEQKMVTDAPDEKYRATYNYALEYSQPVIALDRDGLQISFKILHATLHADKFESKDRVGLFFRPRCWDMDAVTHAGTSIDVDLRFRLEPIAEGVKVVPAELSVPITDEAFDISKPAKCRGAGLLNGWLRKKAVRLARNSIDRLGAKAAKRISERIAQLSVERERLETTAVFRSPWNPEASWAYKFTATHVSTETGALYIVFSTDDLEVASEPAGHLVPTPDAGSSFVAVSDSLFEEYLRRWVFTPQPVSLSLARGGAKVFRNEAFLALIPGLRQVDREARLQAALQFLSRPSFRIDTDREEGVRMNIESVSARFSFLDVSKPEAREVAAFQLRLSLRLVPLTNPEGGLSFRLESAQVDLEPGSGNDDELLGSILAEVIAGAIWNTERHPIYVRPIRLGGRAELALRAIRGDHGFLRIEFGPGESFDPLMPGIVQAKR